jgi:hypothetical protein
MASDTQAALSQLNSVNAKIAALTSQINSLQGQIDKSLNGPKANRLTDAQQDNIQDQLDALKGQRGDLQEQAAALYPQAYPQEVKAKEAEKTAAEQERQQAKLEREQEREATKKGWNDDTAASDRATKTGPVENRKKTAWSESTTSNELSQTGGGSTSLKSAPNTAEQEAYYKKQKDLEAADDAKNRAAEAEYLRKKGLPADISGPQRRAALREGRNSGEITESKSAEEFRSSTPPPKGAPSTTVREEGANIERKQETVEKEGAKPQTAADAVNTSDTKGTGTDASKIDGVQKLTPEEKKQLDNAGIRAETSDSVVQPTKTTTNIADSSPGAKPATNTGTGGTAVTAVTTTGSDTSAAGATKGTSTTTSTLLTSTGQTAGKSAEPSEASTRSADLDKAKKIVVSKYGTEKPSVTTLTPNKLHSYATYTYGITLHALTKDSYNELAAGAKGHTWLNKAFTLISTGGRWGDRSSNNTNFVRPPEFKDDFYFDGLSLSTVIGLSKETKASNAIDLSFTIVEPYGLTLINRLLNLSTKLDQPNYTENPYVLQIDFFGSNDAGESIHPIPDITKYIPIKIIDMKIRVGTQGATYACRASPYNHTAFAQTVASTPADIEVTATTVGDFFANDSDDPALQKQINVKSQQRETLKASQEAQQRGDLTEAEIKKLQDLEGSYKTALRTRSYTSAYNALQKYLVAQETIKHATEIRFDIAPVIKNSQIVYPKKTAISNVAMTDSRDGKQVAAATAGNSKKKAATPTAGANQNLEKFNIKAGENIIEVINKVLRTSKYITDQVKDEKDTANESLIMNWFKIIPKIELTNFDILQNKWATKVTYKIITYKHHNTKHPDAPISKQAEILKDIRKKYSYIYTGENQDIIDFQIDFNALYINAVKVLQENSVRLSNAAAPAKKANERGNKLPAQRTGTVQPNQVFPLVGDLTQQGFNSGSNAEVQKAADVMNSIYTATRADMIQLKMKIIGDPDFIKQDDIYLAPGTPSYPSDEEVHSPDGSILTDRGDIFVFVTYKTIVDMDQTTGLPRQGDKNEDYLKTTESSFSGVYRLIKITSEFRSGRFEQTIEATRIHDDVVDVKAAESLIQRNAVSASNKTGQTTLNSTDKAKVIETPKAVKEEPYQAKLVLAQSQPSKDVDAGTSSTSTADATKLGNIADNGATKTPDQQAADASVSKDGTVPNTSEARPQQVQPDTGGKVATEPGARPTAETDKPKTIDNNNLPAGVTSDPNTGLYLYRGRRFSANDSADLQAKVNAIDSGTTIKTTKTDAESGAQKDVEFKGNDPVPKSTNADVAKLQDDYQQAASDAWNAQRRLGFIEPGGIKADESEEVKANIRNTNTKILNDANARMAAIEAQLKDKGAAPR